MNIYKFSPSSGSKYYGVYIEEEDLDRVEDIGRHSLLDAWEPLKLDVEVKRNRKYTDFPCLELYYMVLTENSYRVYRDCIAVTDGMEALPCKSNKGDLYLINIWGLVDCFCPSASIYTSFPGTTSIREASKYEFHADRIPAQLIFRIPEEKLTTFVTQEFVDLAKLHKLFGLNLSRVWPNPEGVNTEASLSKLFHLERNVATVPEPSAIEDEVILALSRASESLENTEVYGGSILSARPDLIELNSTLSQMVLGESTSWPKDLLAIGSDGAGNYYAFDKSGAVQVFYHEAEVFEKVAKDLIEFTDWLKKWAQ